MSVDWDPEKYKRMVETARSCETYMSSLKWELQGFIDGDVDDFDLHECAYWTGETPNKDKGIFYIDGMSIKPYRLLWELKYGLLPKGIVLRHTCCSKGQCCNLHHLEPGDTFDNFVDRYSQGTYRGPHISEVIPIYETGVNPAPERITERQINEITLGLTWKRLTGNTEKARERRIKWGLQAEPPKPFQGEIERKCASFKGTKGSRLNKYHKSLKPMEGFKTINI